MKNFLYNEDCIQGAIEHLDENSVDLIVTDPPYGIDGDTFDKHYNRNGCVLPGYVEVPNKRYNSFTHAWMEQAHRVLRPNGIMYVVSGWTKISSILVAAEDLGFETVNHLIWQFNFGVYTSRKFVSSHYHIPMFRKKPKRGEAKANPYTFNAEPPEREEHRKALTEARGLKKETKASYHDRQDTFFIPKQYRTGEVRNQNQLPHELVEKLIAHSSNPGDMVCDFFMGGFTTAFVAERMGRNVCGFEMNEHAYNHFTPMFGGKK